MGKTNEKPRITIQKDIPLLSKSVFYTSSISGNDAYYGIGLFGGFELGNITQSNSNILLKPLIISKSNKPLVTK